MCAKVLSARRFIILSTNLYETKTLKPEFLAFARRDANELPSLPLLVLRAYTMGVFFGLNLVLGVITAGLSAVILPSKQLPRAVVLCARWILWSTGITVRHKGERARVNEAPCLVANHNSAFDIIVLLTQRCCFVSMDAVRSIPVVGKVAEALGCIFVARDCKESRQSAKDKMAARLSSQVEGTSKIPCQLVVFPEGSTNNGYCMLMFRRGAFEANVPIQPLWIEFADHTLNFTVVSLSELGALACSLPSREVTLHWCPVVQPDAERPPEATAELARQSIASLKSAYGHPKLELMDATASHRDAIACANYMRSSF